MQLTLLPGYPDMIGRRRDFVGYGSGPTSYNPTTGDPLSAVGYETYFDIVNDTPQDPTGTYYAKARPNVVGPRATWSLHWFVVSSGAEVGSTIDLSAISLQVGGKMGQY